MVNVTVGNFLTRSKDPSCRGCSKHQQRWGKGRNGWQGRRHEKWPFQLVNSPMQKRGDRFSNSSFSVSLSLSLTFSFFHTHVLSLKNMLKHIRTHKWKFTNTVLLVSTHVFGFYSLALPNFRSSNF